MWASSFWGIYLFIHEGSGSLGGGARDGLSLGSKED